MQGIDRRAFLAGLSAAATVPFGPAQPAAAATYPLVPALPSPLTDQMRARIILTILEMDSALRNRPEASDDRDADAYKMVIARKRMALIWHRADSLERMASIARRYPPSRLRMQALMDARLAGADEWIGLWISRPIAYSY
jgi:hypothetical protein